MIWPIKRTRLYLQGGFRTGKQVKMPVCYESMNGKTGVPGTVASLAKGRSMGKHRPEKEKACPGSAWKERKSGAYRPGSYKNGPSLRSTLSDDKVYG